MSEWHRITSKPIELGELTAFPEVDLVKALIYFCCNVYNKFNYALLTQLNPTHYMIIQTNRATIQVTEVYNMQNMEEINI